MLKNNYDDEEEINQIIYSELKNKLGNKLQWAITGGAPISNTVFNFIKTILVDVNISNS